MKRSTTVALLVTGTAAIGLTGCKPRPESYPDAQACIDSGKHTEQECRDAFSEAQREHEMNARHFTTRDDCIAVYGPDGCEERPYFSGGGSFFMPLMMGYMLGQGFGYHPLYRDPRRDDGLQSSSGVGFGGYSYGYHAGYGGSGVGFGRSTGGSTAGETSTVSRGGFGGIGHGLSAGS